MRALIFAVAVMVSTSAPVVAEAFECGRVVHDGAKFTACRMHPATVDLRLFLNDPDTGRPIGSFTNLETLIEDEGRELIFAMNAGMYHQDRRPVGHYIEEGQEQVRVITSDGPGNFGLLPNGVFCIEGRRARVIETQRFVADKPSCDYASQSGPMLVIDGDLHPRFKQDSDSVFIRNGVGTSEDGRTVWFAISEEPVNFHLFARLFRDAFSVPQALYFDGNISRIYVPELERHDGGFPMGPIVGAVTRPAKGS